MKLLDAMKIINAAGGSGNGARQPTHHYALVCGFTPLAAATFLRAHLQQRAGAGDVVALSEGRYGDLTGNLERAAAAAEALDGSAVVVEWEDLDRRLGYRHAAPMSAADVADDVARTVGESCARLLGRIEALAARAPVALCMPTLPLPPVFVTPGERASAAEAALRAHVAGLAARAAAVAGVRLVSAQRLDAESPPAARLDVASDVQFGFPYQRAHAERVAALLAALLRPATPKKGLITDLDDTLWRGILGDAGVAGVAWSLEHHAQVHALYQHTLASLAASGVLVAVASKNDPALAEEALARDDLLVERERIFPVHAGWGPKSDAVRAILRAWNVGPESVVFVDDSPMEVAEVQAQFPAVECHLFKPDDPAAVLTLLARLRDAFGRDTVREEDRLRAASLRAAAAAATVEPPDGRGGATDVEAFLRQLDASVQVALRGDPDDGRALELVNKTNQFNLNGRRVGDAEWKRALARDGAFLLTVSYRDKFGPLGKIAAASGRASGRVVRLDTWVMSCRAFARRVEHQTVRALFEAFDADVLELDFAHTERNGPLREFLAAVGVALPDGAGLAALTREAFAAACPPLYQTCAVEVSGVAGAHAESAASRGGG